ncbi:hypothetical protein GH808_11405 [Acetobacterium fimetarium]|uniref:Transposase n=1 Tax=Acetobacterium fimetarium TaxID=52691 RepID=A0ABR6WWP7_9FIRM|nr:hypothetical protein [Acetobacterium fimetarium]MBC3805038.1 hypothetical protein [Acetobacterium fimetarium]
MPLKLHSATVSLYIWKTFKKDDTKKDHPIKDGQKKSLLRTVGASLARPQRQYPKPTHRAGCTRPVDQAIVGTI